MEDCIQCGAEERGPICGPCSLGLPKICDFCNSPSPAYKYPTRTFQTAFQTTVISNSVGGWTACEDCHWLIEANRWTELADKIAPDILVKLDGQESLDEIKAFILGQWLSFRENRKGDAERIDN